MSSLLRHRALAVLTAVFLLTTAVAAGLAFAGSDLLDDPAIAAPLLLVLGGTGAAALVGWAAERARREELVERHGDERARLEAERMLERQDAAATAARLEAELDAARAGFEADRSARAEVEEELRVRLDGLERALPDERARYESRLDAANDALLLERGALGRSEDARRTERQWAFQIRRQLSVLARERGPLGDSRAVRELLLRTGMALLGAGKGLLLRREDGPEGSGLRLLCQEGFTADPAASVLVARAARTAVESGAPLREEDEARIAASRGAPADTEIENLLAIPFAGEDEPGGVILLANRDGGFDDHPDDVLLALGTSVAAVLAEARLREELRSAFLATVAVLADAIEAKDRFLLGHAADVATYVTAVADRLGLEPRRREELVYAALLHDVGKIAISEQILMKPAALTSEERGVVQLHARIGALLVRQVPALRPVEAAVLHHHERWDGGGYPEGLAGEAIPIEARIIAVADAFSAMTADRPYRKPMTISEACDELERHAARQFDPRCVRLFAEEVRRRPPTPERPDALRRALADLELAAEQGSEDAHFVRIRSQAPSPRNTTAGWN
jgi:HD-GYP domain-containing protein (c-di-GMP phosphodiesterase class II)